MATDPALDALISELAASLDRSQRAAFETAARAALAAAGCSGCGAAYRVLAPLQREFFDPPSDARALSGPRHHRLSKLSQAEPIGAPDPREDGRARRALRTV
jgi:hypothetical protein